MEFLSTLSLRRATLGLPAGQPSTPDFYPRSPCGERLILHLYISYYNKYFYPRSPCGERPRRESRQQPAGEISIHALLAESDPLKNAITAVPQQISIHALLAESDCFLSVMSFAQTHFYPRSPCGERRRIPQNHLSADGISIHALLAESDDTWARGSRVTYVISIHALLAESDDNLTQGVFNLFTFLSTLSLRRATTTLSVWTSLHQEFLSTLSLRRATFLLFLVYS